MYKDATAVRVDDLKHNSRSGLVNTIYLIDIAFPETYLDRKERGQLGALAVSQKDIVELMLCSSYSNLNDINNGLAYVTLEISENYLLIFYRDLQLAGDLVQVRVPDEQPVEQAQSVQEVTVAPSERPKVPKTAAKKPAATKTSTAKATTTKTAAKKPAAKKAATKKVAE